MGNFASSADRNPEEFGIELVTFHREPEQQPEYEQEMTVCACEVCDFCEDHDIVKQLVSTAIDTCRRSVQRVFAGAKSAFASEDQQSTEDDYGEYDDMMDAVFDEFQIVYEDNYVSKSSMKSIKNLDNWSFLKPTLKTDDCCASSTTDTTECISDCESKCDLDSCIDDQDLPEYFDEDDDVETKAARLLRLASTVPDEEKLYVEDYLCHCGDCPLYKVIARDVKQVVTWREPEELASVMRILQGFSTYNEVIGYDKSMIVTADECLYDWCGDEDQAFKSFVLLHDDIPSLCAGEWA
ncbi:hypothetical protein Poli38472_014376 [Pythium oligandrum]|uniref:Uncharacterized protein n=1 Tax=Pythium oligandrum TaxID=41045 RepID=A0A8K1C7P4_PYTOL|nr:hypothetical protein Poli38472_014376 [Pythium oligandrum]|eukprot:TMW57773.1 hypothetical protein Poli38472_014376 [Pythium oligandrum]